MDSSSILNEAPNDYIPSRKKSRAKQININEMLKYRSPADMSLFLPTEFSTSKLISKQKFNITNSQKRAVSAHSREKKDKPAADVNKVLSQVLLDFKKMKTREHEQIKEKKERFQVASSNFDELAQHALLLSKHISKENTCSIIKNKPPISQPAQRSRCILKELNLGKRAVSMNNPIYQQRLTRNGQENSSTSVKKSPTQHICGIDKANLEKFFNDDNKSLTFKELDLNENKLTPKSSEVKNISVSLKAEESVPISIPVRIRTLSVERKSRTLEPPSSDNPNDVPSLQTYGYQDAKNYLNLIELNKNENKASFRLSLKDGMKRKNSSNRSISSNFVSKNKNTEEIRFVKLKTIFS